MHDVVDVLPQVVVFANVAGKASLRLLVEDESIQTADEADVLLVSVHEVLLFSQLRKSVDDDTKKNVVKDNLKN